jgi:hypothetical protein
MPSRVQSGTLLKRDTEPGFREDHGSDPNQQSDNVEILIFYLAKCNPELEFKQFAAAEFGLFCAYNRVGVFILTATRRVQPKVGISLGI